MRTKFDLLKKGLRVTVMFSGGIFLFCLLFSFTTGPFFIYHWLGTSVSNYQFKPDYIIIMGGSGYPSESAMMRSYFAAEKGNQFPQSVVIVTQPSVTGLSLTQTDAYGIAKDLIIRGIDSTRIVLEVEGKNTREEAINVLKIAPQSKNANCLIVTSPEHMRRSVLTFRKAGFNHLGGDPTFNISGPVDLAYKDDSLGGRNIPLPDVGGSIQLRYQFWNHLRYQVICYRELFALAWYRIRGWI